MALLRRHNTDAAFERLYERHVADVYRYSLAVLGDRSDAEDVTQTTFLNAYRAFQQGQRPEKPQNWLIAIAHNVCRQRFRQASRRPREVEFDDAIGGVADELEGTTVDDLRRAFSQLAPNQRAALVMRELEGRPYSEIAETLGVTVSALETLLFRARRALREQLEEQLTCGEAALAISKGLDGMLTTAEQRGLRAHLRACPECARSAASQRAQRKVLRGMLAVPVPSSLATFFGGGAATTAAAGSAAAVGGSGVAIKAAAILTAGVVAGTGAVVGVEQRPFTGHAKKPPAARAAAATPAAAAPRRVVVAAPVHRSAPATAVVGPTRGKNAAGPAKHDERAGHEKLAKGKRAKPAKREQPAKAGQRAKAEKPAKAGKSAKAEPTRPERRPKAEKPERRPRAAKREQTTQPARPARPTKAKKATVAAKPEKTAAAAATKVKRERPVKAEKPAKAHAKKAKPASGACCGNTEGQHGDIPEAVTTP